MLLLLNKILQTEITSTCICHLDIGVILVNVFFPFLKVDKS